MSTTVAETPAERFEDLLVGTAISAVMPILAATIKNPQGHSALRLRAHVEELKKACDTFLALVPAPEGS